MSLILSTLLLAAITGWARADVPECVVLLCDAEQQADMWLQGATSEAVRLYHTIFGGWLPVSCKPGAARRRVLGCITDEQLCTEIAMTPGRFRTEACQTEGCQFERFFPEEDNVKQAKEWLDIAEGYLKQAWDIFEALQYDRCTDTDNFTYPEVIALSCAAEAIYSDVLKTLTPESPWLQPKFRFSHIITAPTLLNLYETDGKPEPDGDLNDFVHKQRAIETFVTCCSDVNDHHPELLSISLYVDPKARGLASIRQQLLWVIRVPVSPFAGDQCDGFPSNIVDTTHTAFEDEFGPGDTVTVAQPEPGVSWPGPINHYAYPDTAVLANSTDDFWPPENAGELINVTPDEELIPAKRRAFAFASLRTSGIEPHHVHGNDDDDDDLLVPRVVVRMFDEVNDNCHDYDASVQVFVKACEPCTWPFEGMPVGPVSLAEGADAVCISGLRAGEQCDPHTAAQTQCTAAGACLQTTVNILNGVSVDEFVCFDWPKPGVNPAYPCKPNPDGCPYGVCHSGSGAYPAFGSSSDWYDTPDLGAVVSAV